MPWKKHAGQDSTKNGCQYFPIKELNAKMNESITATNKTFKEKMTGAESD